MCCASCGIAEIDDVKLKPCDGCDLVRYCSDECKEDHRSEHAAKCTERAAELRDEILFRQPEKTHLGDCPICCVPLPLDPERSTTSSCCSKYICTGCVYACWLQWRGTNVQTLCPFCRDPITTEEEGELKLMKRVEANDPVALCRFGGDLYRKGDYESAFEYFTRAAELGDAESHFKLAEMYEKEQGVEQDEKKEVYLPF